MIVSVGIIASRANRKGLLWEAFFYGCMAGSFFLHHPLCRHPHTFFSDKFKSIRFTAEACLRLQERHAGRQKDNMTNTSKTKGFLTPVGAIPVYDNDLDTVFRQFIAGVTGLDSSFVGSCWTESLSDPATDEGTCCQAAVVSYGGNPGPSIVHNGTDPTDADDGTDVLTWQEELTLLTRFYGPKAEFYAALLKYGCMVKQNADELLANGIVFASADKTVSEIVTVNNLPVKETSLSLYFRRSVSFTYQVRNIARGIINYF